MLLVDGLTFGLVDMHTLKPLDTAAVCIEAAASGGPLITVEEHNVVGGLGSAVAEAVSEMCPGVRVHRHGIPDASQPDRPADASLPALRPRR